MNAGRVVVITGVSRGLGEAMVREFVRRDCLVAGCSRSSAAMDRLQKEFGAAHLFEVVDVADDSQVEVWAGRVLRRFKTPDLLINNAAIINRNAALWDVPAAEFSSVIDVNIKGPVNVIRHIVPAMIARKHGVVVNISSGWGRSTDAEVAPYCATKWAIEGLTQAMARELPEGMAAVPLNPGVINTSMLQSCFGQAASSYPDPAEWAGRAVPFLLQLGPKDNGRPLTV